MVTYSLPQKWSLEHDGDDYTVYSPGQQHGGSLGCALECGSIIGDDSDIHIPPAVLRALECHGRALECHPQAVRDVAIGQYILCSPLAETVYRRGSARAGGNISCTSTDDANRAVFLHPDAVVYVDFSF